MQTTHISMCHILPLCFTVLMQTTLNTYENRYILCHTDRVAILDCSMDTTSKNKQSSIQHLIC